MNKRRVFKAAAIGLLTAVLPASASAAPLLFEFDSAGEGPDFSFVLDQTPTVSPANVQFGLSFTVEDVEVTGDFSGTFDFEFFNRIAFGGFRIEDGSSILFDIALGQLYTGTELAPVFLTGTFCSVFSIGCQADKLTITPFVDADPVPLPAAWAVMVLGLGAFGGAAKRRREPN